MKIKEIFLCWDFLLTVIISIIIFLILPVDISASFGKEAYNMGINVLSIVFSIYFAALAIIMSAGDDDFVKFLEEEDNYSALLGTFKYSIFLTFIALVWSIIMFIGISYHLSENPNYIQHKGYMVAYGFIFLYSLFTVFNSTLNSLKYAEFRTMFLKIK